MPDVSDANATQVPESDSVEEFGYRQELRRSLGFKELLVYGMLFMVPTAPMGVYGLVSQAAPGQVPLVYLVGVLAMLFTAIAFRNLSAAFPIAGSVYAYVQRGLNPHVGFVGGWLILLDYLMVPSLLYAFVGAWLHGLYPPIPAWIYVAAIIVAITSLNVLGITITARANWILFGLQILVLLAFVGTALLWLLSRGDAGASLSRLWRPGPVDLGVIGAASSTAVLSYLGFDGISTLAEEAKDPRRNVGRAIMACLLL
ncbi:MAG: APC family permease, partial [Spirochaetota bacterium]